MYKFRMVEEADAEQLLKVYAPYVISEDRQLSDVSFEYELPSQEEFRERIRTISAKYPYIVVQERNRIVGYAYAHPYIQREAYQWGAEVTIYLDASVHGKGLGEQLYSKLEQLLKRQGLINLYACITKSNLPSVKFHEYMGYKINGVFDKSGFKHGHWLDMVWMEKQIQAYQEKPELIKSIKEIKIEDVLA